MGVCRLNGARLYFHMAGKGEPLLLLHGLGSSSADWELQVPEFSRHFRVIAPDFRGFGGSSREGPYGVEVFAADMWRLLDHLKVRRFHLLGYSMGGAVAQQMALDRPERIRGLVLSNTLPSFRPDTVGRRLMLVWRLLMMSLLGPRRLSEAVAQKLFPNPDQAELRRRIAERRAGNDKSAYLGSLRALVRWSAEERLAQLDRPLLILAAEHDYFSRAEAEAFAAALPKAQLEILAGARHGMPLGAPERFNRAVLDHLLKA